MYVFHFMIYKEKVIGIVTCFLCIKNYQGVLFYFSDKNIEN